MFDKIVDLLQGKTDLLWAAVVSAAVSAAVAYYFRRREMRFQLEAEYEYEQRKKLRNLIGAYHGRLLNASVSLNHRLWNLYANHAEGWLSVDGDYSEQNHYFHSTVHRFIAVCALIRRFERESVHVDGRIALESDFLFLRYIAALRWCMTDVALFTSLEYDRFYETDHFFSDNFRIYCDSCVDDSGSVVEFPSLAERVQEDRSLDPVLSFFDGLSPAEDRYRWDRVVSFHLLLMGFINNICYEEQVSAQAHFDQVAVQAKHPAVLKNLIDWLPRHGLDDRLGAKRIRKACRTRLNRLTMRCT